MKIDTVTLYGILKGGNIYGGNLAQFKEDRIIGVVKINWDV